MSDGERVLRLEEVLPIPFPRRKAAEVGELSVADVRAEVARCLAGLGQMPLAELAGKVRGLLDFAEDAGHPEVGEEMIEEVGRVLGEDVLEGWMQDIVEAKAIESIFEDQENNPKPVLFSCTSCHLQWVKTDEFSECPECRTRTAKIVYETTSTYDDWWMKAKPTFEEILRPAGHTGPAYKVGLVPLGFKFNVQPSEQEVHLVAMGQVALRPTLLLIAPECPSGHVVDLYTGNWLQNGGVDPLPISLFQPDKWRKVPELPRWQLWRMHTLGPAQQAHIHLRFDEPLRDKRLVKAMLWCIGAEP